MDVLYREHECLSLIIRLPRHRIKVVCFSPPVSELPRGPVPCHGCPVDPPWPAGPQPARPCSAERTCLAPHISALPTFRSPLAAIRDESPPPVFSALESRVSALGSPTQAFQIWLQGSRLQQYVGPSDVLLTAGWGRNSHTRCLLLPTLPNTRPAHRRLRSCLPLPYFLHFDSLKSREPSFLTLVSLCECFWVK